VFCRCEIRALFLSWLGCSENSTVINELVRLFASPTLDCPLMTHKRQRTARTTSRSSVQTSPVQSRSPSPQPTDKKSRFEKRFDTANTSDVDVLGMYYRPIANFLLTDLIEKQRRTWTSSVYDHFDAPQIFRDGTSVRYVFICKRCVFFSLSL
jgi:hypothetical protein